MKIAVTYDNGAVFQHFGKTEEFKLYHVEDGIVVDAQIISSNGSGHDALAQFLAELGVDTLICGGIGGGAQEALCDAGITIFTGAEGNADDAVESYLHGTLSSAGVNCTHHQGEDHCCCGSESGEGCGCGCGCHSRMEGKNVGKTCRVHYRGTFNDGTQFDASYDRGEPLEFVCGAGMMIPGFDRAVADMDVGQHLDIHLMPEDAYGEADPNAILSAPIAQLPGAENLVVGQQVYLYNSMGQPFRAKVIEKDAQIITFDANHEMAGKELNFHIELVEVL